MTVKNDSEGWEAGHKFYRADLSHSVNTLGAALRSLSRHPDLVGVASEIQLIYNELNSELKLLREKEKRDLQQRV